MNAGRLWLWIGLPVSSVFMLMTSFAWLFILEGDQSIGPEPLKVHPIVGMAFFLVVTILCLHVGLWEGRRLFRLIPGMEGEQFKRLARWMALCSSGGWGAGTSILALCAYQTAGGDPDELPTVVQVLLVAGLCLPMLASLYGIWKIGPVIERIVSGSEN